MPLHLLNIPLQAVCDVQRLVIRPTEAAVGQVDAVRAADDVCFWDPVRVDHENGTETRMADEEIAFLVERQAIRARVSKRGEEDAALGGGPVLVQRQPPYLVGSRHGYVEKALIH